MQKTDVLLAIDRMNQALSRLEDALGRVKDDLDRDGAIQRFEFSIELLWKTLRIIPDYQGISCQSPRNCIKMAFRHGLIEDGEVFLDMIEDRNRSSHIDNDQVAEAIFQRIKSVYAGSLRRLLSTLEQNI